MSPEPKKQPSQPVPQEPEDVDFAEEAGPKETELGNEADAKDATRGEFDRVT